ncbi:MAG: chromosomal replication initiator protein DnaA [Planctomycetaceae bacterium]|nr:chromosomal replication initiator protein DnaA [Planctomycetaceae bacterium]
MLPDRELDHAGLARQAAELLEAAIGERRYRHWFLGKARLSIRHDELTVTLGNPYLLNWVQKQFAESLSDVSRKVLGSGARVRLDVAADQADAPRSATALRPAAASRSTAPAPAPKSRHYSDLRQFIVGAGNELACAAAQQVAAAPGEKYNPLYIYGGVGSGKTHLLEGIYRRIRKEFPSLRLLLLTAENFSNYFSQALTEKSLPAFRQRFRGVDVLLIDDADFFDGKKSFQEEFVNTLKKLEREGKQIIVASDRHPRLLTRSSDELVSRLISGLVCRIEAPDLPCRRAIAAQRGQTLRLNADEAVLDFVAERFTNNAREIIGAVNCLHTYQTMTAKRVALSAARTLLANLERDCLRIVRIADVESAVCRLFKVTPDELKSSCRARALAHPRMLAMYLSRRMTQSPYSEIGRYFGGRDHATVMSAERKIAGLIESSGELRVAAESWSVQDVVRSLEQQILAG